MQALFMIKQAWGVVSGSVSPPPATQADKLEAYNTLKQMTAGLIWLALEPPQQILIQSELGDGVKMWTQLKQLHASNASAPARFLAYDQLLNVKLEEGESLTQLISRVESAQVNVQLLRPSAYTLKELDDDLAAMSLIRALDSC